MFLGVNPVKTQLRPNNHSAKICISRMTTCRIQNFTILWELLSISISIHLSAEVNIGVNPATYNDIDWYTSVNINWYTSIHIYTNQYKDVVDIADEIVSCLASYGVEDMLELEKLVIQKDGNEKTTDAAMSDLLSNYTGLENLLEEPLILLGR